MAELGHPCSQATISALLKGQAIPEWRFVVSYARAIDELLPARDPVDLKALESDYRRILADSAPAAAPRTPDPDEEASPGSPGPGRALRFLRRHWIALSTAVTIVLALLGVVFAAIGPVLGPAEDSSSLDSLQVKTSPMDDSPRSFFLPADAPLNEYPRDEASVCSEHQISWLAHHGQEVHFDYAVTVKNVATSGSEISLTGVRAKDIVKSPPRPAIWFTCPSAGGGDISTLSLDLDKGGQSKLIDERTGTKTSGSLFSFNLSPGESGAIHLVLPGVQYGYSGKIAATLWQGGRTRRVSIPLDGTGDGFHRPGLGASAELFVRPPEPLDPGFRCVHPSISQDSFPCSVDDIRLETWRRWGGVGTSAGSTGQACGTIGSRRLGTSSPQVSCAKARELMSAYAKDAPSRGGGNTLQVQYGDWTCSTPTADTSASEAITSVCDGPSGVKVFLY